MSHFVYKLGTYFFTRISSNNVFYMEISQGTLNMMGFRLRLSLHRNFSCPKLLVGLSFAVKYYILITKKSPLWNMNVFSHLSTKNQPPPPTPPPFKLPPQQAVSPCRSARNFDWANRTFHRPRGGEFRWTAPDRFMPWIYHLSAEQLVDHPTSNLGKKVG